MTLRSSLRICTALAAICAAHPAFAGYVIGSGNEAVIEPPISHPKETPCEVPLYVGAKFGANNVNFTYNPPADCTGPYAKIILDVGVSLDKGIQYDRTGTLWIAGVPLWFGTTAEPNPQVGPSWSFERDVTNFASLLATPQTGFVLIANYTNPVDTSIITSHAKLLFYPATAQYPAPRVPDLVLPLSSPGGGTVALNTGTDTLSTTVTLPTNILNATLDVYLQGQSNDEFWYTCVPTALSGELESCGNSAFREGEITVDGVPAGVAPISPWIFTGGIDPYLWAPIPGVQTLDFKPFPADLSPFAGVMSNGAPHTIAVSVYNANSYFSAAGALFLYLDPNSTTVTGAVTKNTLSAAPSPTSTNTIMTNGDTTSGGVNTRSKHDFTIIGTVVASGGTYTHTLKQTSLFTNDQTFLIDDTEYLQSIKQNTTTQVTTNTSGPGGTTSYTASHTTPLALKIIERPTANGGFKQITSVDQQFLYSLLEEANGEPVSQSTSSNAITTQDTLKIDKKDYISGNTGMKSTATLITTSSTAPCFQRVLTAAANVLTSATTGCPK